jgi:hypothetical protein
MQALLAKGADPHSVNANADRLLALCKPLAAAGLYHFVRSAAAAAASPTLVDLFPEFKPREGETTDAVVAQLVGLVELLNEGLQLYPDRRQLLEELRQLVVAHLTSVDAKQSSRIARNTKQLSFSSLSPEELAALKKKRKNEKEADADDEDEAEAEDDGVAAKKAKVANGDQVKKEGQAEEEEEEVIEEPDIGTPCRTTHNTRRTRREVLNVFVLLLLMHTQRSATTSSRFRSRRPRSGPSSWPSGSWTTSSSAGTAPRPVASISCGAPMAGAVRTTTRRRRARPTTTTMRTSGTYTTPSSTCATSRTAPTATTSTTSSRPLATALARTSSISGTLRAVGGEL